MSENETKPAPKVGDTVQIIVFAEDYIEYDGVIEYVSKDGRAEIRLAEFDEDEGRGTITLGAKYVDERWHSIDDRPIPIWRWRQNGGGNK